MPVTANYGWTTPTEGGDVGTWDTILNTLFDDIDTEVEMNVLASPYYLDAGATVIDWDLVRRARKRAFEGDQSKDPRRRRISAVNVDPR